MNAHFLYSHAPKKRKYFDFGDTNGLNFVTTWDYLSAPRLCSSCIVYRTFLHFELNKFRILLWLKVLPITMK